ncbi:hypothetical protein P3342_009918 [Pyrenophora teres f. teres]|uniref:PAT1 multi-domain protein n=1 Tax=Pyrenophora teres f. teres TaxID=97479 RepID=A0A6S6WI47_9PLEO|nr:hypothetical protein PTNB85_05834 [Pyrenophora teres f. teres]KAE8860788.1 hypothetical protein PTNB29_05883 [Pyrenophora teres f. teres]KAK1912317.1 hypothetical protein P3342_009918 [Pyrenophora teres f. teres]CAE7195614.1 PAT1 multi-domain protein [Pyrenophora teres f. teres]
MPPKRKSKAAKAVSATPRRTSAASALSNKRSGLQGSKTSRLAPSVPFQMTTRRGAKGTSNHTSSAGPSSASSGSRRSSLNEIAQNEDATSDHGDARPAKRSRTSSDSGSPQRSNGSLDNNTPMNGTQTPELQNPVSGATSTAPKTAGKKRRASDDSTQSSKTRPNSVLTRTQSDVSEQQPRKKRKTKQTPADTSADQPPELTDASTAPNSPEQMPDVDGSQSLQNVLPTNGEAPAKSGRRLPGRRRQPHPDINVETDLRRQLNLKMSYRSLAKVQKVLLEELATRTTRNLEDDPNYHKECPEYQAVMAQLDQRRDARLDQVNSLRTCRLEELERVRIAEEHIQKEQYINRFRELQDDFMLQIYFRAKKLEREMKGQDADATDDEDNVLPPTYSDEPHHNNDDRIGSKFASRSRAYIEADRELKDESVRRKFTMARIAFVEKDEDADDSIEDVAGGFAKFDGPDRTEALARYNMNSLADAAIEVERTPSPQPQPQKPEVIPNEHAALLMMLADVSAYQPRTSAVQKPQYHYPTPQQSQQPPPPRATTPIIKQEHVKEKTPDYAPLAPLDMSSQAAHSSPIKNAQPAVDLTREAPRPESNGVAPAKEVEAPTKSTPRFSTHRIMDILNDDQEVPVSRTREPPAQAQELQRTASMGEAVSHHQPQSRHDALRVDAVVNREEPPVDQALMDILSGPPPPPSNPPSSPPHSAQPWPPRSSVPPQPRESDESLRRRDPLQKIRELLDRKALDRKARENGQEQPDRPQYWPPPVFPPSRSNPPTSTTQERTEVAAYDPTRPATGLYDGLPGTSHSYTSRRQSYDHPPPHWEHDRRGSVSQAQQQAASPYQSHAPQPHYGEHHKSGRTPPTHQSPYAPPSGSLPLPPKPPGPLPSAPINFRFAHYDPVPPRQPYPPQSPNYPSSSHPPQGPPLPQYPQPYGSAPSYQGGYVPPPGSFQAPPPPPSSLPPYQPLKIHQYGGQPILPANMAPPQQQGGPPPLPYLTQAAPPPPQQGSQQQAYSPTHPHPPPHTQYDERDSQAQNNGDRSSDPQSRPRRPYRSYHAPGTQFRSYQGPGEQRRRGG